MMKDEEWMIKDDDFKLLRGFDYRWMDRQTDICEYRVAFVTDNKQYYETSGITLESCSK